MGVRFTVRAPGRVNLIGDHTDYTGGLVLPMAIDRWTVIDGVPDADEVWLESADDPDPVAFTSPIDDPATVEPSWGRYVAGVFAEMGSTAQPFRGRVTTDIPVGAGLSSSAALEVAVALALGFDGSVIELAELGRRAEHRASGVPCGIMDQLCVAAGRDGHALLIDCGDLSIDSVALPAGIEVVVQFVAHRTLMGSAYADRVAECAAAEREIGPLRAASVDQLASIPDALVRRRARHVITENARVRNFADALRNGRIDAAGALMVESHASLRDDFATSTAEMDSVVAALSTAPGVHGVRMTGGGFGGCVVMLVDTGADVVGWRVRAVDGARRVDVHA